MNRTIAESFWRTSCLLVAICLNIRAAGSEGLVEKVTRLVGCADPELLWEGGAFYIAPATARSAIDSGELKRRGFTLADTVAAGDAKNIVARAPAQFPLRTAVSKPDTNGVSILGSGEGAGYWALCRTSSGPCWVLQPADAETPLLLVRPAAVRPDSTGYVQIHPGGLCLSSWIMPGDSETLSTDALLVEDESRLQKLTNDVVTFARPQSASGAIVRVAFLAGNDWTPADLKDKSASVGERGFALTVQTNASIALEWLQPTNLYHLSRHNP